MKTPFLTLAVVLVSGFVSGPYALYSLRGEAVWNGPGGSWSDPAQWLEGLSPPAGGDTDLSVRFLSRGLAGVSSLNDLGAPFLLNALRLENQPSLVIGSAPGDSLQFSGEGAAIQARGIGPATLLSPIVLDSASLRVEAGIQSSLLLSGVLSQTGGNRRLVIAGDPGLRNTQITLGGANTFTGGVTIESGNLTIKSRTALGSGPVEVKGGTLRIEGSNLTIGNAFSMQSDLVVLGSEGATLAGVLSSSRPEAGLVLRAGLPASGGMAGSRTLTLTNISTYTGPTIIDYPATLGVLAGTGELLSAPNLILTGFGRLLNTSAIEVRAGGTLTLTASYWDGRIADTTPVTLRGGNLVLSNQLQYPSEMETIGELFGSGFSSVQLVTSQALTRSVLRAAELHRLDRGTFEFRGDKLGSAPVSVTNVFVSAPPALAGAGKSGPQVSILPYAIARVGEVYSLATYDIAAGIRPLNTTTEFTDLASANPGTNVRLTGDATTRSDQSMNALQVDGASSVSGSGGLKIASGTLLVQGSRLTTISNSIDFGTAEANIFALNELRLSGLLRGSGGLTKSGPSSLYLYGPNEIIGPLTINAGLVFLGPSSSLGPDTSPIVINGQNAGIGSNGALTIRRNVETGTGLAQLNVAYGAMTMNGVISGAGGLRIFGNALLVLNGANTYTGPTQLAGHVSIASDAAFGVNGELAFHSSRVTLAGPWISNREINVNSSGAVDTNGFDAAWNGYLGGSGELLKAGAGRLLLTRGGAFSGPLSVLQGAMTLAGAAAVQSNSVTVRSGAAFVLDDSEGYVSDRLAVNASVSLTDAALVLRGNASAAVRRDFGSLTTGNGEVTLETQGAPVGGNFLALNQTAPGTLIRGDNLGREAGAAFTRVTFTNVPTLRGGAIPGVYAGDTATGGRTSPALYDARVDAGGTIGVRPIIESEFARGSVVANLVNGGETPPDGNFLAQGTVTAAGAVNTMNSLTVDPGTRLTLGPDQKLIVREGGILARGRGLVSKIVGGTIDFDTNPGLVYADSDINVSGAISGTSGFTKLGPGTLTVADLQNLSGGVLVTAGTLVMSGAMKETGTVTVATGAALRGAGSAGTTSVAGRLEPGVGPGVLDVASLSMGYSSELAVELGSPTSYDQVRVGAAGGVTLGLDTRLTLSLVDGYDPVDWVDSFMIVAKYSPGPIAGYFSQGDSLLLEGRAFSVGAQEFQITYLGGDGNDIVLKAVPEPSSASLMLGTILLFVGSRRPVRRRKARVILGQSFRNDYWHTMTPPREREIAEGSALTFHTCGIAEASLVPAVPLAVPHPPVLHWPLLSCRVRHRQAARTFARPG